VYIWCNHGNAKKEAIETRAAGVAAAAGSRQANRQNGEAAASQRDRILVDLIEQGIEARQQKEKAFFELAERFRAAMSTNKSRELGDQLADSWLASNATD